MILTDAVARDALREDLATHLGWDPARQDPRIRQLDRIYRSMDDPRVPGAIIPLVRDERVAFSAVADTAADWRRLAPLAVAAVGVTLTDFSGVPTAASDPVEEILSEHGLQFSSFGTPVGDRDRARKSVESLERLITTLQTMPVAPRDLPRSPAQLLHELDLALLNGDRDTSRSLLLELERRRAVDTLNLRFLTVRWHGTFRQWRELRDETWFGDLCRTRRPLRVTVELLRAIYEADLEGPTLIGDPAALLERFRDRVAGHAGDLFTALLLDEGPATALILALDAAERGDGERIVALRGIPVATWDRIERESFEAILELGSPSATPSATDAESTLTERLQQLIEGPPLKDAELTALRLLAESSGLLRDREQGASAGTTTEEGIARAVTDDAGSSELPDDWATGSWEGWFDALPRLSERRARELAEGLADEVDVGGALATDADCERFTRSLEEALSHHEEQAVGGLAHIAGWLQRDDSWPNVNLAPLYRALITDFLLFDTRTPERLGLTLSLVDGWLMTGPSASDYSAVLGEFRDSLDSLASDRTLDSLIDLAELLVVHTVQDLGARASLWAELHSRFSRYQARMTRSQVVILNGVCDAMGLPQAFQAPEADAKDPDPVAAWRGTIGIYSLRPAVCQRVVDALAERVPSATVDWRDDHVATDALRQLVARSEVMAVDWTAAKHAATDAINATLGQRSPLWVRGGASSIVSKIVEEIERSVTSE
ncbi:MAG: protein DpdD [Chloroflexi bacterium]|nr:protein DpdD [Chloroflexota bacterium]